MPHCAQTLGKVSGIRAIVEQRDEVEKFMKVIEDQEEPNNFKFGVLYVKEGQVEENEMFQNSTALKLVNFKF